MKVTIFTSNQPRHLNLTRLMSEISDEVFLISEVNTLFPGTVDDFFRKSDIMKEYFSNVINAEKNIFGEVEFLPKNVNTLSIKSGDLNKLNFNHLKKALSSDIYIVFGASYIKGWLIDYLLENKALNIHIGISPYYRGSSCNFWALHDHNFSYVGATIHMLGKGLDSGDILFHSIPLIKEFDTPFDFTMRAVEAAQKGILDSIKDMSILKMPLIKQNKENEIRYTKNKDFTDEIAEEFMSRKIDLKNVRIEYPKLICPKFI
tara:strand:+ start:432 stop:1214 length:783 start_codon:yes stop_codon:yes gene_type:complete